MSPPTGEREGALDLDELERLLGKGTPAPWRLGGYNNTETVGPLTDEFDRDASAYDKEGVPTVKTIIQRDGGVYPPRHDDQALIIALRNHGPALLALARRAPSEKPSAASPAQPGEGEPSADEWAKAMKHCADFIKLCRPSLNAIERDISEDVEAMTRALLERRGGKGLSGKRDRG